MTKEQEKTFIENEMKELKQTVRDGYGHLKLDNKEYKEHLARELEWRAESYFDDDCALLVIDTTKYPKLKELGYLDDFSSSHTDGNNIFTYLDKDTMNYHFGYTYWDYRDEFELKIYAEDIVNDYTELDEYEDKKEFEKLEDIIEIELRNLETDFEFQLKEKVDLFFEVKCAIDDIVEGKNYEAMTEEQINDKVKEYDYDYNNITSEIKDIVKDNDGTIKLEKAHFYLNFIHSDDELYYIEIDWVNEIGIINLEVVQDEN